MSKIPPKSPSTNFQILGKFKNPIFNSEIPFPYFRPSRPCGPLGRWPSRPAVLSPLLQAAAHRPAQAAQPARLVGVIAEVRFLLGFTPSVLGAFSLSTTDAWVLHVSSIFPTTPADPGRKSSASPLPASPTPRLRCRQDFTAPSSFPPLIPLKPSLNGNSPHCYSGHPPWRPPRAL
jgi:hypothetical protein